MAYRPTGRAEEPARGPKGSVGTDTFGSESAPTSKWNSTVPQQSAGEGDYPYPDAHSTVPTPDADRGDYYPWPAERGDMPGRTDAGEGEYPVPQERSTVGPQNAGSGASGPRREYPADTTSSKFMDYAGGDGGDYRFGVPYSQNAPVTPKWGMNGPDNGGFGHSDDVKNVDFHASDDWGKHLGMEDKGYEVLGQERDGPPPAAEVNEAADFDSPGSESQYPQPEDTSYSR